jgi:hypothetical protein
LHGPSDILVPLHPVETRTGGYPAYDNDNTGGVEDGIISPRYIERERERERKIPSKRRRSLRIPRVRFF